MQTILLADDERNLRALVAETLDESSYRILQAANGEEALSIARAEIPDLIILDWMMPGISGLDVLKELRKQPETVNVPVILLTARSQQPDRAAGIEAGASAFLSKPFSPLELLETAEELIGVGH
jgi:two-component system phosphate regulon response regulator PhoB